MKFKIMHNYVSKYIMNAYMRELSYPAKSTGLSCISWLS
jgi:hypothetical protein